MQFSQGRFEREYSSESEYRVVRSVPQGLSIYFSPPHGSQHLSRLKSVCVVGMGTEFSVLETGCLCRA
jgi:hypothetical protein